MPKPLPQLDEKYRFCYALVNGGDQIVTVEYPMIGLLIGRPPAPGVELALLGSADPTTCDENGSRGTRGYFVKERFQVTSERTLWKAPGSYSYPEGRTLRIFYEFVEAPSTTLDLIEQEAEKNSRNPDYPGFSPLPSDVRQLARISVRAATPPPGLKCE